MNEFVSIYLNDLLIFSENIKKYKKYVKKMFQKLRKIKLMIDIFKNEFHVIEIKYLNLIVFTTGLRMDSRKIK